MNQQQTFHKILEKVFEEVIDLEEPYRTLIKKIHLVNTNLETKEIVDLLIMNFNKIEHVKIIYQ
jgi:hypothetical protein